MKTGFSNDPHFSAVVITGGPCAGKTTFLAKARERLEGQGLRVAVLAEGATDLITAGLAPWNAWRHPLAFQHYLLRYNLDREELFYRMLSTAETDRPLVLLCDRGVLDAMAYISRDEFLEVLEDEGLVLHHLLERYKAVIHLVTAADGAEEYYTLANNAARTESPELARDLDRRTQAAWLGHQHLHIIDNSAGSFHVKMERAIAALARTLSMPEPLEKERKFVVHLYDPAMLSSAVAVEITQDYLVSIGDTERRVRARRHQGATTFYYTEKEGTGVLGQRIERERQITMREYEMFLRERDASAMTIIKTRFTFAYGGHHLELDVYRNPSGLTVLEVEVADLNEHIELPPGLDVLEVTGDPLYSNAAISRGSLSGTTVSPAE